uniref:Uncharacterized protein n=1 Tax=Amphimedon queenslandica TaxID=400682 RepID=A0A1X7V801_AMPQE
MALFGDGGRTRREPRSVIEFRAGKMTLSGTTVSPDVRKGLVYMKYEDSLMHFCWKDRGSGKLEDDFIIFPGDAKLLRVSQCTTGRVFLLKFKDNGRKYFYWLQEPKDDKDEDYMKKVNDCIDNPTAAVAANSESAMGEHRLPQSYMANLLHGAGSDGTVTHQQLLELLAMSGGAGGGGGTAPTGTGGGGGSNRMDILHGRGPGLGAGHVIPTDRAQQRPQLQIGDLQTALESLQMPPPPAGGSGASPSGRREEGERESGLQLNEVLTSEALRPIVREGDIGSDLAPHLPPTNEDTETALTSPQFQQAMSVFSSALSSGQLGPLVNEFGLNTGVSNAAATGNVEAFAEAMEKELKENKEEKDEEGGAGGGGEDENK